jgi:hypothetical protein
MKVRNIFTGQVYEARWSFKDSASRWGQPILLLEPDCQPVDAVFFEVLESEEKKAEGPQGLG